MYIYIGQPEKTFSFSAAILLFVFMSLVFRPVDAAAKSYKGVLEKLNVEEATNTNNAPNIFTSGKTSSYSKKENKVFLSELSISDFSISEVGGTATFDVTLTTDQVGLGNFSVTYQVFNGTAINGNDFTATTTSTLNFAGTNNEVQSVTITIIDDAVFEGNEILSARISNSSNPAVTILDNEGTGTILDNDAPDRSIFISDFSATEASGTANFVITYSGPTIPNAFDVQFTINNGSAVAPDDFSVANAGPITFPANTTGGDTQVITINIVDDAVIESAESLTAILTSVSTPTISIVDGLGSGSITDNDTPSPDQGISVSDFVVNEGVGNINFNVSLNVDVSESFTVMYNISDGSATSGSDYTAVPFGTLSFSGNNGEVQAVSVNIIDDIDLEGFEILSISLFNLSTNQISIIDGNAFGQIVDNDTPNTNEGVSASNFTVDEAAGTTSFDISLNVDVPGGFTVDYTITDGTATAGNDYSALLTGTLPFVGLSGETITVPVNIIDDAFLEGAEFLSIALSNLSTNSIFIVDGNAFGTIADNDQPSPGQGISVTGFEVNEAAGTADYTVIYTGPDVENAFTIDYIINNVTASSPQDYIALTPSFVTFPAGTESGETQLVTVNIIDDNVIENTEILSISLTGISQNAITIVVSAAMGSISDNDSTGAGEGVFVSDFTVNEDIGTTDFVINYLGPNVQEAFSVDFNVTEGSATNPEDYTVDTAGNSVTFPPGTTSGATQIVTINIINDAIIESAENLDIALSNVSNDEIGILDGNGIGTITANDSDPSLGISVADFTVNEAAGTTTFDVSLNVAVQGGFSVDYDISDGTANVGSDYTATTTEAINFAGTLGEVVSITVNINDDTIIETAETLTVALSNISNSMVAIIDGNATGTITDNDSSPSSGISVSDFTVDEGSGTANFIITSNIGVQGGFSVESTIFDGGAIAGSDYTATTTATINFTGNAGEEQFVIINIIDDTLVEPSENLTILLDNISNPRVAIVDDAATGIITDNDNDPSLGISVTDFTVDESAGTATFNVSSNVDVQGSFSLDYTISDGTANSGADYTATATGTLNFTGTAGQVQSLTITIIDDNLLEGSENLDIVLSNISNVLVNIVDGNAVGTITDNDIPAVGDGITVSDFSVNEDAGTTNYVFTYTGSTVQDAFTVTYNVNDGSANRPSDYTVTTPGTASFPAGTTSGTTQSVTVNIIDDNIIEVTETLTLEILSISNPLIIIVDGDGDGTITDNDSDTNLGISVSDFTVDEGAGTTTFNVTSNIGVQGGFTVDYSISDGTAIAGSDYTATAAGTLNFTGTAGEVQSVTITIIEDNIIEPSENLTILLSNISNPLVAMVDNAGTGVITDNDSGSTNGISVNDFTVDEAAGTVTFDISLNTNVTGGFSVDYTITDGFASVGNDYTATMSGTVNFAGNNGEIESVSVTIIDDALLEASEDLNITLSNISNVLVAIVDANGIGTITDNDAAGAGDGIAVSDFTVNEDVGTTDFVVTYTGPTVSGAFTVDFTIADGSALSPDDYTVASATGNLTFPDGTTDG
uniref:beta strand repeat-containing protein n=1 Tax=Maribacter antarcticus TaxID=505250 RepID=UPI000564A6E9